MNIEAIIPMLLNSLVANRVYYQATPDNLVRANNVIQDFFIWTIVGGQDREYVDKTFGSHSNARIQLTAVSPSIGNARNLIRAGRDRLLASDYTVGVYGSPVGTYDAARKLHGMRQQFGIWYPE